MGLKFSDIVGEMEKVQILEMQQSEKNNVQVVVLKCKTKDNKPLDVGLFGCAEKILDEHGSKTDGKLWLEIPAAKIKDEGIVWINNPY